MDLNLDLADLHSAHHTIHRNQVMEQTNCTARNSNDDDDAAAAAAAAEAEAGELEGASNNKNNDGVDDDCVGDDEEAFVASCADASFVLNPHNSNNPARRLYVNKLYQPMNGGVLVDEQDDELMLYQELESLESTVLKSANGRRRRTLTKILEDDDDDDDDDEDDISFDSDQNDDEDCDNNDCLSQLSTDDGLEVIRRSSTGGQFQDEALKSPSSLDKLHLATIIDTFGSDHFPPSPLSHDEPPPLQSVELLGITAPSATTSVSNSICTAFAGQQQHAASTELLIECSAPPIDHHHHHHHHLSSNHSRQQQQDHLGQIDDSRHEASFETPPISTYSGESLSANELLMSHSPGSQTSTSHSNNATVGHHQGADTSNKYRRRTANARERIRMREINQAFEKLKRVVPAELIQQHHQQQAAAAAASTTNNGKTAAPVDDEWSTDGQKQANGQQSSAAKLTKITTLRLAKSYITILTELLNEPAGSSNCSSPITGPVGDNEMSGTNNCTISTTNHNNGSLADSSTSTAASCSSQRPVKIPPNNLFNSSKRKQKNQTHQPDSKRRAYKRRGQPASSASRTKSTCQTTTGRISSSSSYKSAPAVAASHDDPPAGGKLDDFWDSRRRQQQQQQQQQQIVSSTTTNCIAVSQPNQIQIQSRQQQQQQYSTYTTTTTTTTDQQQQKQQQPTIQLQPARHHPIFIAATNQMIGRCLLSTNNGYISLAAPQSQAPASLAACSPASQPLRTFVTPVAVAFFGLPSSQQAAPATGWISQPAALGQQAHFLAAASAQQPLAVAPLPVAPAAGPAPKLAATNPAPSPPTAKPAQQQQQQLQDKQRQPAMRTYRFHNYDGKSLYANQADSKHNQQQQPQRRPTTTTTN